MGSKQRQTGAGRRAGFAVVLGVSAVMGVCGLAVGVSHAQGAGAGGAGGVDAEPSATMLRFPAVSDSRIAFVYAGGIWTAPRSGGTAIPIALPTGTTALPKFSPDGKTIAFVGNYDGGRDIYTVPVEGGLPTRVTHHPGAEALAQWGKDGRLVFMTSGLTGGLGRQSQLFTVPATGGLPEQLPMPYAGFGTISQDGEWVVFSPHSTDNRTWKRYRGGMATDLWVMNLKSKETRKITDWEGTDTLPMWGYRQASKTVYYLSDAGPEHRLNIWSFDLESGERKQITTFKDDDVRWPSIGPGPQQERGRGEIVFQLGARLMLLDLDSRESRQVRVTIPGARPKLRPQLEDASDTLYSTSISPTGKRVALVGRGDIWSVPVKDGVARNLSRTNDQFERDATWSPDGRWIAYFSDASGEYELWVRPSDARPEAKKDDEAKGEKGDKAEGDAATPASDAPAGPTEPVKLSNLGAGFRQNLSWSPDSKHVVFNDQKGNISLASLKIEGGTITAEIKTIDKDPWDDGLSMSWSHDSNWLAYVRSDEGTSHGRVWLYNVASGEKTAVTSAMFSAGSPAFDRKGEFLYYVSRNEYTTPMYGDSDGDTSWIYGGTQRINMVPLRTDIKSPLVSLSDEEEIKAEKKADKKPEKKEEKKEERKPDEAAADDGVRGVWSGTAENIPNAPGPMEFTLRVRVDAEGKVSGSLTSPHGTGTISGTYDKASGQLTISATVNGQQVSLSATVKDGAFTGTWSTGGASGPFKGTRTGNDPGTDEPAKADEAKAGKEDKKPLKIDLEGFEARAVRLPIAAGVYYGLSVSHDGKLIYVQGAVRGSGGKTAIKIFDPKDDAKEEKVVVSDVGGYELSADGKKMLIRRGNRVQVIDAAAGGGKAQDVSLSGLRVQVDPRAEWRQIFSDAWRLQRDYFYVENMHGVDWTGMRQHYGAMIEDAASREDVQYIIAEMISELNIGHAYVQAPGDVGPQPETIGVGLLGCDFELVKGDAGAAYKITRVIEGATWDTDARSPLSQAVDPVTGKPAPVKAGEFLLAVNGVPLDTSKDPWAALVGMTERPTLLTVGTNPALGAGTREVLVTPVGSDSTLRFRWWVERNRAYVHEKSGGKIGYIYVPNTGIDGQNELVRLYWGQRDRAGLIIDERWNGGGQIPTRFIELLNRPVTNYWARRGLQDWTWPPDSAQGHKAMLINGLAGSGGDMFPWLFKAGRLGKLIGTRTWGGLVGISGNPRFIDGGSMTVPTFGFYEKDGTWGVEGHGTDPDIEVIDDPGKMVMREDGWHADPQLDAAITHLMGEIDARPYVRPARPADPDRKGMGLPEADR